jgi:two-component system, NtrC family, response regulator AtoC
MDFSILIIDDEIDQCASLSEILEDEGYRTCYTDKPLETIPILERNSIDLVILDLRMPEIGGIKLLKKIRVHNPHIIVLILTAYPSVETAVLAMKFGAVNFYEKPPNIDALLNEIREFANRVPEANVLGSGPSDRIVTISTAMRGIMRAAEKAAATKAPVLITGETGTGKELIAEYLHAHGNRSRRPMVKVNCAALPDTLLESELFGHEKGAFTGAVSRREGKFEIADGGTIFLDEIGDMSLSAQAKILRVIQEHAFERVGGTQTIRTDIRIVAATNKNLAALIEDGVFREDLYYRLCVIPLHMPPLRDRPDDIEKLIDHFIGVFNTTYRRTIVGVEPRTLKILLAHTWPGNVRELKNCIERAVIFCEGEYISMDDLPSQYQNLRGGDLGEHLETDVRRLNRKMILEALEKSDGQKGRAADMLNITRRTLYNRMRKLGLQ